MRKLALSTLLVLASFAANAQDTTKTNASTPRENLEQAFQDRLENAGHKVGEVQMIDGKPGHTVASWRLPTVKEGANGVDTNFVYSGYPNPQSGSATDRKLAEVQKTFADNEGGITRLTHNLETGKTLVTKFTKGADGELVLVVPQQNTSVPDSTSSASTKAKGQGFTIF